MASDRAWRDVGYGSFAGMIAKIYEHPLDLVKVRLQSQDYNKPLQWKGPVDCFLQTARKEGILGLYRGLSMPVIGAMAENATLFVVYNQLQHLISPNHPPEQARPLSQLLLASAGAGAAVSYVLTPVELIKCRMQVQMLHPSAAVDVPGPITLIRQTIREKGFTGLWLGQTGTFLREVGGGMAWFLSFELAIRAFVSRRGVGATKKDLSTGEFMLGGAAAGTGYTVLFFPADSIKSTIQTAEELGKTPQSFLNTGREIWSHRGIKGLYSGCGVTVLRSAPSSALIFAIYSQLERAFG